MHDPSTAGPTLPEPRPDPDLSPNPARDAANSVPDIINNILGCLLMEGCASCRLANARSAWKTTSEPDALSDMQAGAKKLVTWVRHYLVSVNALSRLVAASSGSSSPLVSPMPATAEVIQVPRHCTGLLE